MLFIFWWKQETQVQFDNFFLTEQTSQMSNVDERHEIFSHPVRPRQSIFSIVSDFEVNVSRFYKYVFLFTIIMVVFILFILAGWEIASLLICEEHVISNMFRTYS